MTSVRPWGSFDVLMVGAGYVVKQLVIRPHQRFSLQRHQLRQEVWVIVAGQGYVELGSTEPLVKGFVTVGHRVDIACGLWHRLDNTGDSDLIVIETQLGKPDEQDIERLQDDYGRV